MLGTRNEAIDAYFNGDDWSLQNDIMLMSFLRRRASPHPTLSSMNVFDEVIKQVQIDLDRVLPNDVTLLDVKIRIRALCSWFYDFKEYIAESGVHFNRQDMTVTVDHTQYAEPQHVGQSRNTYKENITRRWFNNHGFPMYEDCVEIFDNKRAAPVDFSGYPGYAHYQPLYIDPSEGTMTNRQSKDNKAIWKAIEVDQFEIIFG